MVTSRLLIFTLVKWIDGVLKVCSYIKDRSNKRDYKSRAITGKSLAEFQLFGVSTQRPVHSGYKRRATHQTLARTRGSGGRTQETHTHTTHKHTHTHSTIQLTQERGEHGKRYTE